MTIYITLIILLYLFTFIKFRRLGLQKFVYWFFISLMAVISGIRYDVGTDFGVQRNYYSWTVQGLTDGWLESGFRFYIRLIEKFFGNFQWFIFIASIFVVFSFGYAIYKHVEEKYWFFALALFVTSTIYFATMNLERQYIAIAFILHAFHCLRQKKYLWVVLFTALAYLFHSSALAFILFYVLCFFAGKMKKKNIYDIVNVVMIISLVGAVVDFRGIVLKVGTLIIPARYLGYLSSDFFMTRNWISLLKFILPDIIWFIWYFKQKKEKSNDMTEMHIVMLGCCIWLVINNFFYGVNVIIRIGMYFEWFILLALPKLVAYGKDAKTRVSLRVLILTYYLALTVYSIFIMNGHGVIPYQTFFNGSI